MRALNIKLLRNLWSLKGQGGAIAMVIAAGVATFIMSLTALDSLRMTQQSVYQSQHFADVFADLKRAPESLADRLRDIPGVSTLETRVVAPVNLQMPDFDEPVTGMMISIPDGRQPQLNQLFLRAGIMPDPLRANQVLVSEAFAQAHHLQPGDLLSVVINGRYQRLEISGIALSPEFIYLIRPGDLFPDFSRFGVLWMNRSALAAAFDMEGAFNSLVMTLSPAATPQEVIEPVDLLLASWGGLGAYARENQLSHRYLDQELDQLESMARILPMIFIGVAAFLLNIVTARLIRTQREQIAVLKAFGYDNLVIAWHYLALVLMVVLIGAVAGILLGVWMASGLATIYQEYFRFPWLAFHLRPAVAVMAVVIAGSAAIFGTVGAVRRAFRLPPAEAMRPEPPPVYRRTLLERLGVEWFSQPTRMILRNIERQPLKALLSTLGIAFGVAMMMLTSFMQGSVVHMIDVQFRLSQQQDATVSFNEAASARAVHELRAMPGVRHAEGFRVVPAILVNGHRQYRTAVQGYRQDGRLFSILDEQLRVIRLPDAGVMLTDHLADMLGVSVGDKLQIRVQEGHRPVLDVQVAGLVREYIGVSAYMSQEALNRVLKEGDRVSGVFLAVDSSMLVDLNRQLEQIPRVAGVTLRETAINTFYEMMDETILMMTFFTMFLAGSMAFAVVYNNARITFAERGRDLATLQVLGLTRGEIAFILLGELVLLTLLAIPLGFFIGAAFCWLLTVGMQTDIYRIPLVLTLDTYALSAAVVLLATLLSALLIGRSLVQLDMVSALKANE